MQASGTLPSSFWFYIAARFLSLFSHQMLLVALGQYIYILTQRTMPLAWMGLAIFMPRVVLVLLAGHMADRFNRKYIMIVCRFLSFGVSLLFILLYLDKVHSMIWWYVLLAALGSIFAFDGPANQAIIPDIVSDNDLPKAIAFNASNMQLAMISGPAAGGLIYALTGGPLAVLVTISICRLVSALLVIPVKARRVENHPAEISWQSLMAGIQYVWNKKIILGTISLDLFAVLLGGAVALMPVFANDILHVGAWGLGLLRAAPCLGAILMAFYLAKSKPLENAGPAMLMSVALFGLATIGFGLSKNFLLSILCLTILGAADMVSVQIRHTLVQLLTPQEMRGRVGAVSLVFIGASNELGEFESGVVAALIGTVAAVVTGGLGTLGIVVLWALLFPEIRKLKTLSAHRDPL